MEFESEHEFESPSILLTGATGETLSLNWGNTCLRIFDNPDFNHIEFTDDEGQIHGIPMDEDFRSVLDEKRFPTLTMPYVDRETFEWKVASETRNLATEIDNAS